MAATRSTLASRDVRSIRTGLPFDRRSTTSCARKSRSSSRSAAFSRAARAAHVFGTVEWRKLPMESIGPYSLDSELGRGAMGAVFRGFDPAIGRAVAIKIIRLDQFATANEKADLKLRFAREAAAAGKLSHPNIVTVYHLGEQGDTQYLVLELVEGWSLEETLSNWKASRPQDRDCHPVPGGWRSRLRPRRRHRSSRCEACQYSRPPGRKGQNHRFRNCEDPLSDRHQDRLHHGNTGLYGAGTDHELQSERAGRSVLFGRDCLSDAQRTDALYRRHRSGLDL